MYIYNKHVFKTTLLISAVIGLLLCSTTRANAAVLVSNTGQTDSTTETNLVDEERQAQQFTTGATPHKLTTVAFNIRNAAPDTAENFTIAIQGERNGNPDGVDIVSQGVPSESTAGTKTIHFTASNVVLKPSTNYYVVFTYTGDTTDSLALQTTTADAEDGGGQSDASINNVFHRYANDVWTTVDRAIEIAVSGDTGAIIYLTNASDTGPSQYDNYTHDHTPTVTLSGFTGAVSITATADGETDVTASHTGDGQAVIPALTKNKSWTITARDSATPQNTASFEVYIGDMLVGNFHLNRITRAGIAFSSTEGQHAQGFTTTDTGPYALESVRYNVHSLHAASFPEDTLTISVQGMNSSGNPDGNRLAYITIENDVLGTLGEKTATFPEPVELTQNTDYFIVFDHHLPISRDFRLTALYNNLSTRYHEDDPIGTALTGWSLSNAVRTYRYDHEDQTPLGWSGASTEQSAILMSLQGFLVPPQSVDLKAESDSGISRTDNITNETEPIITVSGFNSGENVTVTATKTGSSSVTAAIVGNGDVALETLAEGRWIIKASNGVDASLGIPVTIDTTKPTLSNILDLGTVYTQTPTFTFTSSEAGVITWGGNCSSTTTSAMQGANTVTFNTLALGQHANCTITVADTAGNDSDTEAIPSFTVAAGAITITMDQTNPAQSRSATATVTGASPSNLKWALFDPNADPVETCDSTLDFTGASAYVSGEAVTVASAEADNGKQACFTATISGVAVYQASTAITGIDRTAPTAPSTPDLATADDTGVSNSDNITNKTTGLTFTVTATGEDGGTVQLYNGSTAVGTATTIAANTVSIDIPLTEGTHTITAKTTDQAGNESTASSPVTITVDTTKPATPALPDLTTDTGVSQTDNITNDNTPTITTPSVANTTYEWTIDGTVSTTLTTASITTTALSDGDHTFSVKLTDQAGNQSTASPVLTITVDTTIPDATVSGTNFTGHLSSTDLYINKADADDTSEAILTAPTQSFTYSYKVVGSSTTCDGNVSYASDIPETSDVTTDGTHKICIKAEDTAGNIQYISTPTFTRDIAPPATPVAPDLTTASDSGSSNSDNITNDDTPTVTTPSVANATYEWTVDGTVVSSATTRSITTTSLSDGDHTFSVKLTDQAGNQSAASPDLTVTVDTTKPTLTQLKSLGTVYTQTPTFTFTSSEAGVITWGGGCSSATTAASQGNNSVVFTTLSVGRHANCTITVADTAGNDSDTEAIPSFTVAIGAIAITMDQTNPAQSRSATATVTGTTVTGLKWKLFDPNLNTPETCDSTLDFTGASAYVSGEAVTVASAEADNGKQVCFTATIEGTPTYQASAVITGIDRTAPTAPTTPDLATADDTGVSNSDNITNKTTGLTFTVTATGEDGGTVQLYNGNTAVGTATTIAANTVSIDIPLVAGTHTITAKTTDQAGNVSTSSSPVTITVDTTKPATPALPDLTTDTGSSQTDNITNDNTPTITTPSVANTTYEWTIDGTVSTTLTTASITTAALSEGDHTFSVKLIDRAGNQSTASPVLTITVDTTDPAAPTGLDLNQNDDTGSSNADNITNKTSGLTIAVTATGEDGGTVRLYNGSTAIGSATTISSNSASIDISLATGSTHQITAKTTDKAGNVSDASTALAITVDNTAPTLTQIADLETVYTQTPTLTFTSSEAGVITWGGSCSSSTISATLGNNSVIFTTLTPGTYSNCTITVTDTAGNDSDTEYIPSFTVSAGDISITMDQTDPAQSRSAIATVAGTSPTNLKWALFDPNADPAENCGSGLSFPAGNTYISGNAVTVASTEADNGKQVCFTATIEGTAIYQASAVITGIDRVAPILNTATTERTRKTNTITITIEVVHNSHTTAQDPETIKVVFGGDCSGFVPATSFENQAPDNQVATYSTKVKAANGEYATCTVAAEDEAGNMSNTITLNDVTVRRLGGGGGGGGVRNIYEETYVSIEDVAKQISEENADATEQIAEEGAGEGQVLSLIEIAPVFTRNLTVGDTGEDVRTLQRLLNQNGFIVSESGYGSPEQETEYFGEKTHQALSEYQKANGITPAQGYFGPITRTHANEDSTKDITGDLTTKEIIPQDDRMFALIQNVAWQISEASASQGQVASSVEVVDVFTRDLTIGSTGEDVRMLQHFLNQNGFIVSESGYGSPGQETEYFGEKTRQALSNYQKENGIAPAQGYFGPITRTHINETQQ